MSELRKYGVLLTTVKAIPFDLVQPDGVDLEVAATFVAGDVKISKDGGAETNTTNLPTDEGSGYRLILTATELQAARIRITIIDQTGTKVWLDINIMIETYGNASAMHALDLDDAVRGGMTALPNAAADAAGGLAISDAGGLDLDAIATNALAAKDDLANATDGLTALKAVLDTINTATGGLAGAAMRGTDGANTTAPDNATIAAIADYLDTEIAAILTDTGTTIPGLIAALNNLSEAQVNAQADLALSDFFTSSAKLVDDIWDELVTGHTINNTYGKILKGISEGWVADEGSVNDASATTTSFISDLTNATDSFFSDATVVFVTGALKGQSRIVSNYNGTTKAFTFDEAFTSAPSDTDTFIVLAQHNHTITAIKEFVRAEMDSNSTQLAAIVNDTDITLPALLAIIDAVVDAIKAKTDQMVFTKANELDSNVQSINDIAITGNGSTSPFDV